MFTVRRVRSSFDGRVCVCVCVTCHGSSSGSTATKQVELMMRVRVLLGEVVTSFTRVHWSVGDKSSSRPRLCQVVQ